MHALLCCTHCHNRSRDHYSAMRCYAMLSLCCLLIETASQTNTGSRPALSQGRPIESLMACLHYTSTLFASHAPRCTVLLLRCVASRLREHLTHRQARVQPYREVGRSRAWYSHRTQHAALCCRCAVLPLDRGSISYKYGLTASITARSSDREPDGMLALHTHAFRIARTTLHCAAAALCCLSLEGAPNTHTGSRPALS